MLFEVRISDIEIFSGTGTSEDSYIVNQVTICGFFCFNIY